MVLTRRKYGPQGSVFDTDTGQTVQKMQAGVRHILQDGQYYPYLWDQQKKILKYYGDPLLEMRFTAQGIEFWQDGVRQFTGKFNFERNMGTWDKLAVAASGLSITETKENEATKQLEISYTLGGIEATGKISLRAGGFHKAFFGFDLTSLLAAELRVIFETNIDEVPEEIKIPEEKDAPPTLRVGYLFKNKGWFHGWKKEEIVDHAGEKITGGYKLKMKEGIYAKDEKKSLYPTSIGPYSVAANADDGTITNAFYSAGPSADGIGTPGYNFAGASEWDWDFYRFQITDEIPAGATINAGTILEQYGLGSWSWLATDDLDYRATDGDNSAAPTTYAQRPTTSGGSTVTTDAIVIKSDVTWAAGWNVSPSIASIIQELHDSYDLAANDYMVLWCKQNNVGDGGCVYSELNEYVGTANTAKLTIVYTPPAATLEQKAFRFRNDDGNEAAASWLAAQNENITRAKNTNTRLRMLLQATGDPPANAYQLECRKQGVGDYKKIN